MNWYLIVFSPELGKKAFGPFSEESRAIDLLMELQVENSIYRFETYPSMFSTPEEAFKEWQEEQVGVS